MRETVLVLGGYGAIGQHVAAGCAGARRVLVAGRDGQAAVAMAGRLPGHAVGREVDARDPDAVAALVRQDQVDAVVDATGSEDLDVVAAVVRAGAHVVDISASPGHVRRLRRLDPVARRAGRSVLASVGLAPGLSNLAAARLHELTPSSPVDITVLLGLGEDHGAASRAFTLRQIGQDVTDPWTGRTLRAFSDPREVVLPGGLGPRAAYRVASADASVLAEDLGVPVTTRYAFDPDGRPAPRGS